MVALALQAQVTTWEVRDTIEARAARGRLGGMRALLDMVPHAPPMSGDAP